jgi:hypothetical protein
MLKNLLLLVGGALIGVAVYHFLFAKLGATPPTAGPSYETAITVAQGRSMVETSRSAPAYASLKTETNEQLKALNLSMSAINTMSGFYGSRMTGLRIYPIFKTGKTPGEYSFSMVVVPTSGNESTNNDLLTDNYMYEYSRPCPRLCDTGGGL